MRRIYLRRWSPRSKLYLVLALACGAGAFVAVRGYEARLDALRPIAGTPVPVVVASRPLERGTVLTDEVLRVTSVPSAFAPPGRLPSVEAAVDRTLVSDLAQGEPVTRTRLGSAGGPVAAQVPSGLRAFVVPAGVPEGAVRPGDRVDVLATYGGQRPYTETVASGLEVLSVIAAEPGTLTVGGDGGTSLVLLVSTDAAERLAYATAFGQVTVTIQGSTA